MARNEEKVEGIVELGAASETTQGAGTHFVEPIGLMDKTGISDQ